MEDDSKFRNIWTENAKHITLLETAPGGLAATRNKLSSSNGMAAEGVSISAALSARHTTKYKRVSGISGMSTSGKVRERSVSVNGNANCWLRVGLDLNPRSVRYSFGVKRSEIRPSHGLSPRMRATESEAFLISIQRALSPVSRANVLFSDGLLGFRFASPQALR